VDVDFQQVLRNGVANLERGARSAAPRDTIERLARNSSG
jgi:hypothetical protein